MNHHPQRTPGSGSASSQSTPALPQANIFSPGIMPRHLPPSDQPGQQSPPMRFAPQPTGFPAGHLPQQVLSPGVFAGNGNRGFAPPPPQQQGAYGAPVYWQQPMAQQYAQQQHPPQQFPPPPYSQQQQQYPLQGFPQHLQQLSYPGAPGAYHYQQHQQVPQNAGYNWAPGHVAHQMHSPHHARPIQSPYPGQQGFPVHNMSHQSYMSSHPSQQQYLGQQPQYQVQQTPPPATFEPGGQIERAFKQHATNGALELKALVSALDSLGFSKHTYENYLEIFRTADKDCSGNISLSEFSAIIQYLIGTSAFSRANNRYSLEVRGFRTALETLNINLEYDDVMKYFGKADGDQGCTIDEKEFIAVLSTIASEHNISVDKMWRHLAQVPTAGITPEMADAAFSWADPTNTGYLDINMLITALKRLNMNSNYDQVKSLFPKFDADKSGHISRAEFVAQFAVGEAKRGIPKNKYTSIKGKR